jgi:glutamate N-acetyltransferase/amino-acid N-acetyltransferase
VSQALPQPKGYRSIAKNVGVKEGRLDFAVVASLTDAASAAVFTRSTFCGAAVTVGRDHIADGLLRATVVISGNANVATGQQGIDDMLEITEAVGTALGVERSRILPAATGVIGRLLPMAYLLTWA